MFCAPLHPEIIKSAPPKRSARGPVMPRFMIDASWASNTRFPAPGPVQSGAENAGVAGFEPTHGGVKVRCLFPAALRAPGTPNVVMSAAALRACAAVRPRPWTPPEMLGWLDSNQRMAESKSAAYSPPRCARRGPLTLLCPLRRFAPALR